MTNKELIEQVQEIIQHAQEVGYFPGEVEFLELLARYQEALIILEQLAKFGVGGLLPVEYVERARKLVEA